MRLLSLKRDIKDLGRLRQIVTILVKQGFHGLVSKAHLARLAKFSARLQGEERETTPQHVRETLEKLGPTFVKLGQVLSLRPDLIPQEYCDEFRKLQDEVPPLSFPVVKGVIEAELRRPLRSVFKEVKEHPVAAASIAQVHEARLKNGRRVAVKVQRPGVRDVMRRDIDIMVFLARHLDKHYPALSFSDIVAEFAKYTGRELDLTVEARTLEQIGAFFAESPAVVIPKAYPKLSSSRLLIMDYVQGVHLSDTARLAKTKHDPKHLLRTGFEAVFRMVFELGIFHADPHPGNMIACRRQGEEALAFIDFGIVGYVDKEQQRDLVQFLNALTLQDVPGVTRAVLKLGECGVNPHRLERILRGEIAKWRGDNVSEEPLSGLAFNVIQLCIKEGVRFPADVILLVKAYVTMEGSARWLDPEMDFTAMARPLLTDYFTKTHDAAWLKKEALKDLHGFHDLVKEVPYAANMLMRSIEEGKVEVALDHDEFSRWERFRDQEVSRRTLALICGAFFVGSAFIAALAAELSWLGFPLYQLGFLLFFVTLLMFVYVTMKTYKYVESH